jgi:MATE family multidrug resistance protein
MYAEQPDDASPAPHRAAPRLAGELAELARLAAPMVVARAGVMTMAFVDTIMVGRFAARELAYQSIANAVMGPLLMAMIGLLLGTTVMTARALGAGRPAECGAVWRRSLPYAAMLGLGAAAVCACGEWVLRLLGQEPALAAGGGAVLLVFGLGAPALLVFLATSFFLEGLKRPWPGMLVTLAANALNLVLNWLFVWGGFGLPALGAVGSAWSTTLVRVAMAACLVAYVWTMRDGERFGVRRAAPGAWRDWRWRDWREQRRIGYGASVAVAVEAGAFCGLSLYAGWLGILPLGAYGILLNLISIVFMVPLGLAAATSVRVGAAEGRQDGAAAKRAGWLGLAATAAVLLPFVVLFMLAPESLARLYAADPALVAVTAGLIGIATVLLLPDGGQVVMAHALRARGDILAPTLLHVVSYVVVMLPLCWALAFPMGRGVGGLVEGAAVASVVAVAVLAGRFRLLGVRG